MTDPSVQTADRVLRRHGIRYVVVGGQAIALSAATATRDVDVLVTTSDYRTALRRLEGDTELTLAWNGGAVCRFGVRGTPASPLDIVDAGSFAGTKTAEEFFEFLVEEESTEVDGIRYVNPEAVWYTRLLTKRWRTYAEKIVTNVLDGLSPGLLSRVEAIAGRFGTDAILRERIAYVRGELAAQGRGSTGRDAPPR